MLTCYDAGGRCSRGCCCTLYGNELTVCSCIWCQCLTCPTGTVGIGPTRAPTLTKCVAVLLHVTGQFTVLPARAQVYSTTDRYTQLKHSVQNYALVEKTVLPTFIPCTHWYPPFPKNPVECSPLPLAAAVKPGVYSQWLTLHRRAPQRPWYLGSLAVAQSIRGQCSICTPSTFLCRPPSLLQPPLSSKTPSPLLRSTGWQPDGPPPPPPHKPLPAEVPTCSWHCLYCQI
jgi:hypothetical protein